VWATCHIHLQAQLLRLHQSCQYAPCHLTCCFPPIMNGHSQNNSYSADDAHGYAAMPCCCGTVAQPSFPPAAQAHETTRPPAWRTDEPKRKQ
jgi:hypothetical protein